MVTTTPENVQTSQIANVRLKRTALSKFSGLKKWHFGVVPYKIGETVELIERAKIKAAMNHWEKYTRITFVKRNPAEHDNFIIFSNEEECGCCSSVGMVGGSQSIGINCADGWIAHELGHAIGFQHEHKRPDRDEYVDIIKDNSELDDSHFNHTFGKSVDYEVDTFDEPYDLNSIMHYDPAVTSKYEYLEHEIRKYGRSAWNGKWWTLPDISTVIPKKGKNGIVPEIPWIRRLSAIDIRKTNKLYECPECGRTYLDQKAAFTSPEFNKKSTNRTYRCQWRIRVMRFDRIQLNIQDLDIFKTSDCESDYLVVRDGYSHKSPLLGRFCGGNISKHIESTGNRMIINYVSRHTGYRGFSANYKAICHGGNCGKCYQIITDKDDAFSTPDYHNRSFDHGFCWLLA